MLLVAFAGTTAGIIVGLIMPPEAGHNTRESITKQAVNFGGVVKKALQNYTGKSKNKKIGK